MSAEQNKEAAVDDVADLEVDESEQIVGGSHDIDIIKRVDKSSPS